MHIMAGTAGLIICNSCLVNARAVAHGSEASVLNVSSSALLNSRVRSSVFCLSRHRTWTSSCRGVKRLQRIGARAEQPNSSENKTVPGGDVGGAGRLGSRLKLEVDDLKPADHLGTSRDNSAGESEVSGSASAEEPAQRDAAIDVASASAVEDPPGFFQDVEEDAQDVAGKLGTSVQDSAAELQKQAEDLEERQSKEADVLKGKYNGDESGEVGQVVSLGGEEAELTREKAEEKFVETARDGYEVLKWAAEGIVSAGQNARQGLEVVKEVVDKRVKSFGLAADDTREVSSQVAEIAQKKFEELQGSASKFGEELQVNIEEKKAASSLKPESETHPLEKLGQGFQENIELATTRLRENLEKVTAEDGPLDKLGRTLSEGASRANPGSQETIQGDEAEVPSKDEAEVPSKDEAGNYRDDSKADAAAAIKRNYEDEYGNDLLESVEVTPRPQEVPSKDNEAGKS